MMLFHDGDDDGGDDDNDDDDNDHDHDHDHDNDYDSSIHNLIINFHNTSVCNITHIKVNNAVFYKPLVYTQRTK